VCVLIGLPVEMREELSSTAGTRTLNAQFVAGPVSSVAGHHDQLGRAVIDA